MTARRSLSYAAAITVAALVFRLLVVIYGADPVPAILSDSDYYHVVARNLATGDGFTYRNGPSYFWPPGYPFFLAILYKAFAVSVKVALVGNAFAGAATVFVTFLIGRKIWGAQTALIGAAILAVLPSHIFWTPVLLSEIFFTSIFAAALLFALQSTRDETRRIDWLSLVVFGVLLAAGTLVRGQMLVLLPAASLLWWRFGVSWRQLALMTALPLAVVVVAAGAWMIRNQRNFGETGVLSANAGYNLRIGHNPQAIGRFAFLPEFWPAGEEGNLTPERETAFNRDGTSRALHYAFTHPVHEVGLSFEKVYSVYRADVDSFVWIESFGLTPLPNNEARFALIRSISASYYVLLAMALLGAPLALGVRDPERLFLSIILVLWTLVHVLFFGEPRFHVPLLPIMVLMAARVVVVLAERWRAIDVGASLLPTAGT